MRDCVDQEKTQKETSSNLESTSSPWQDRQIDQPFDIVWMALRMTSEVSYTNRIPLQLTSILPWSKGQEADDILFQAKILENLSSSPPYADSGTYFCELGCSLVDIDANIRRFGQSRREGQSTHSPTAKE